MDTDLKNIPHARWGRTKEERAAAAQKLRLIPSKKRQEASRRNGLKHKKK